jgi:hypothetical protein
LAKHIFIWLDSNPRSATADASHKPSNKKKICLLIFIKFCIYLHVFLVFTNIFESEIQKNCASHRHVKIRCLKICSKMTHIACRKWKPTVTACRSRLSKIQCITYTDCTVHKIFPSKFSSLTENSIQSQTFLGRVSTQSSPTKMHSVRIRVLVRWTDFTIYNIYFFKILFMNCWNEKLKKIKWTN